MLVRLLVAVLMLAGPLPVRACTCAAAAKPCVQASKPLVTSAPHAAAHETKGCGCRAKAHAEGRGASEKAKARHFAQAESDAGHSHPGEHDRNCPAVNPRPVISAAVITPAAELPDGPDLCIPLYVESPGAELSRAEPLPDPRPTSGVVPLYISLLTLRI